MTNLSSYRSIWNDLSVLKSLIDLRSTIYPGKIYQKVKSDWWHPNGIHKRIPKDRGNSSGWHW